ncbi:MAG: FadR/GntR family transcriptional regulator [Thermomicrobiales bacterium]
MQLTFTSVPVTRSYEHIVQQIHDAIRSGQLPRGAKLPTERELSETFGVSRSVVREAVKVLAAQGIAESRQGSGTFVLDSPAPFVSRTIMLDVPIEESAIKQLIELREVLDGFAAHGAALRCSEKQASRILETASRMITAAEDDDIEAFGEVDLLSHALIDQAAGNTYLALASSSIRQVQSEMLRIFASHKGSLAIAASQHQRIADAIIASDADAAKQAMIEHVRYTGDTLLKIPKDIRKQMHKFQ